MKKLSIVIPVFNALDSLKYTLKSVINCTDNLYELILVDDCSEKDTQNFIDGLQIDPKLHVRLTKTRNPQHLWTNASWNIGVKLATGDFIAVLNSDIWVSLHWDTQLIAMLESRKCLVACPMEKRGKKLITLDPVIQKFHPGMIKGACFMFRRQETKKFFPIPSELVHWCGDNFIADRAEGRVLFSAGSVITHAITQSARFIPKEEYTHQIHQDVLAYQALSGRDMSLVLKMFKPS